MTPDERFRDALADVDIELAKGATVASAIAEVGADYKIPPETLRMRAERQFGNLSVRRRWHLFRRRCQQDVQEFLAKFDLNSDWQNLFHVEWRYEEFLSQKYKKKVSRQRLALAQDTLHATFQQDRERREADRKARGVRLRYRW